MRFSFPEGTNEKVANLRVLFSDFILISVVIEALLLCFFSSMFMLFSISIKCCFVYIIALVPVQVTTFLFVVITLYFGKKSTKP